MAVSGVGSYTSPTRISGLGSSGLDVDTIVKNLMNVEKAPVVKLGQKRQLTQWTQDAYRGITTTLQGFKSGFFDNLNPSSNMTSQSLYKKSVVTVMDGSSTSTVVSATGSASASAGTHTIIVNKMATADVALGTAVSNALQSSSTAPTIQDSDVAGMVGKKFNVKLDGVTKEITIDQDYTDVDGLAAGLQNLISTAFGKTPTNTDKVNVTNNLGVLTFTTGTGVSNITLSSGSSNDALGSLHITSGSANRINPNLSLAQIANQFATPLVFDSGNSTAGKLTFTINSKEFTFDSTQTLASMMNTINSDATANVNMIYDETSDKFSITAKQLGSGDNIVISQGASGGNFFSGASGIAVGSPVTTQGVDAQVKVDNVDIIRSNNNFTVNGVTYNILGEDPGVTQNVTVTADVDSVFDNIKKFVDKYNEVIGTLNSKISESYDKSYQPLTDDQKSAMSADDIKKWEDKAQVGLLRNDSIIQSALYKMRSALSDSVSGVNTGLSSIGITSGSYDEKGKLYLDETKLKAAIKNDPDSVMNLFSKSSTISYSNTAQKSQRYAEEGLANRLSDILQDNIRTTRDNDGHKGALLEKAGIVGDASEYTNVLYKQITDDNRQISDLTSKLADKESAYYKKFTAMESAITKMQQQGSWLTQQLSGG